MKKPNPYQPHDLSSPRATNSANDQSVFSEPHLDPTHLSRETDDPPAGIHLWARQFSKYVRSDIDHSVWDEPAAVAHPGVNPLADDPLTYANWLEDQSSRWSEGRAWLLTVAISIVSGPCAVLTWLLYIPENRFAYGLVACFFGPLIQEIAKIAVPIWFVEKRPYVFTTWFQFFFCGLLTATVFSAVHIWMLVVIPLPLNEISMSGTMWPVYMLMHCVTATVSAFGLEQIWRNSIQNKRRPEMRDGYRWLITAFVIHALYASIIFVVGFTAHFAWAA